MKSLKIKRLATAGILAALTFLFTAYLHIPSHTGYTHIGDGIIFLAACLLPTPYAASVGAIGGLLADSLTGYAIWAPGTVVIKAVTACFFSSRTKKILSAHNLLALIPSALLCIAGYYLYEVILTQNAVVPLAGIPGYITQSLLSAVFFVLLGLAFDRLDLRNRLLK